MRGPPIFSFEPGTKYAPSGAQFGPAHLSLTFFVKPQTVWSSVAPVAWTVAAPSQPISRLTSPSAAPGTMLSSIQVAGRRAPRWTWPTKPSGRVTAWEAPPARVTVV